MNEAVSCLFPENHRDDSVQFALSEEERTFDCFYTFKIDHPGVFHYNKSKNHII